MKNIDIKDIKDIKKDESIAIGSSSEVLMHLDIRLKDGSVAESTKSMSKPVSFTMGEGVFSDKFEKEILGMKPGDNKKVMLLPKDGFGEAHPANVFQVPKEKFTNFSEPLEQGLIIEFAQINGSEQLGVVKEISDNEVTIDFNHPLSGQVVLFDVSVVAVR